MRQLQKIGIFTKHAVFKKMFFLGELGFKRLYAARDTHYMGNIFCIGQF